LFPESKGKALTFKNSRSKPKSPFNASLTREAYSTLVIEYGEEEEGILGVSGDYGRRLYPGALTRGGARAIRPAATT
jgi:hypothetical protein